MDKVSTLGGASQPRPVAKREGPAGQDQPSHFPTRHIPYGELSRQKLDLYLPRDGKVKSTIVFYYGGGWVSGARWYYRLFGRAMAARGYAVVIPDYHLYPQARFPVFNKDAALAFRWVQSNLNRWGGHPSRVFLMGHSAGAHISATLALDPQYLQVHGLAPSAIRGVIGLAGPYTLNPLKWRGVKDVFSTSVETPHAARPIKLVRADAPAMLLLHGANDRIAGAQASVRLAEALTSLGSNAKVVLYPWIGHFEIFACLLPGWRWRAPVLKAVEGFLAEHS
jgi:acetyl esterase/lipase